MSELSRIEELAQRAADGLADEAAMAELEALMREDASARLTYLQTLQLHQDLERKSARGTLDAAEQGMDPPPDFPLPPLQQPGRLQAIAALALLGLVAWWGFSLQGGIGELVEVSPVQWTERAPGDRLRPHQRLNLNAGSIELRLTSGVRVVLEGEVDAVLKNPMEITLHRGQLFAAVPEQGRGFRVTTPSMHVIDLGTQFGVRVGAAGADVHVFEGEVEVETNLAAPSKQSLTTAQAATFDAQGTLQHWIAPDYEGFAAPLLAPGVVSTSKAVQWVERPSSTLDLTEDGRVTLVLERRNILLEEPLEVTFGPEKFDRPRSGTNSAYDSHREVLEAGTRVDSYLLHFHPRSRNRGPHGGVQFDRPILGAIARGDQLDASDALLGLPEVAYPKGSRRGLEGDANALDVIRFERDQLSVRFWASGSKLDQVRILLEARNFNLLQPEDDA